MTAHFAPVPKTTVNENGKLSPREEEIRPAREIRMQYPTVVPFTYKRHSQAHLCSLIIARPNFSHCNRTGIAHVLESRWEQLL